uniref:Putative secreted protein n=1 Tax=Anopheles darlingi TaxID=43151 RepID=A0A2M4DK14_ANODA
MDILLETCSCLKHRAFALLPIGLLVFVNSFLHDARYTIEHGTGNSYAQHTIMRDSSRFTQNTRLVAACQQRI